ncbi:butyrate kinase [Oceanobacillus massiliensis]|uniref:butyrate kinase n=1 Tax=Oceanobacillus massiliensis TaxID=1465765 RepID=UPI000287E0DD|nr:butyrate kinase [Oceanobacillus massiliensis]
MQSVKRVLVINPGDTFTQIGVFDDDRCIFERKVLHTRQELTSFNSVADQVEYRKQIILGQLFYEGINLSKLTAVCGKGGLLRPIDGGTYKVNHAMLYDLKTAAYGEHTSNLGGIIAYEIATGLNIDSYIVDPVVVDELRDIARYSGIPEIPRRSIFHALNHKAAARKAAAELQANYEDINLIVVHIGRGITVGAHQRGKVVDVNNGLDGEGPFSSERSGGVPVSELIKMCFSEAYSFETIFEYVEGSGGLNAYLQTNDIAEIEKRIDAGDSEAENVYRAMAYQISKEIGAMSVVLCGEVDAIVITGNLGNRSKLTKWIMERVNWIADMIVYPGENELQSLSEGVIRVLRNKEDSKIYSMEEE